MRQFVWCLPTTPSRWNETPLVVQELAARRDTIPRGQVPGDCQVLTAAIDLAKYLCHWIVVAWSPGATGHVVEYGVLEVPSRDLGVEQGLLVALREFRDRVQQGWPRAGEKSSAPVVPQRVWIDAGYMTEVVYSFCRETAAPKQFMPAVGRGAAQQRQQWYNRPTRTGSIVRQRGEGFHINWLQNERLHLVETDADYWKTWVHARLATPLGTPGALAFHAGSPPEHLALARHLTAETKVEEFIAGRGMITRWERLRQQNHWLDALYNACAAASHASIRLLPPPRKSPARHAPRTVPPPTHSSRWPPLDRHQPLAGDDPALRLLISTLSENAVV